MNHMLNQMQIESNALQKIFHKQQKLKIILHEKIEKIKRKEYLAKARKRKNVNQIYQIDKKQNDQMD